ncbi:hypothetical protein [Marininema halotolerans]|uniref:Uncharacterized protein n=1 Tax=Marininema halotolerans TaxID=1155944 RepID=A0A1I6R9P4_9BACL|nr:hypothetical protein [Marininema halotolerans]SFS61433.1 hypothetical protein SAMN05444972_104311 [Marininema halotolerans]
MVEAQQETIVGHRVTVVFTTLRGVRRVRTGEVLRWNARVIVLHRPPSTSDGVATKNVLEVIATARIIAVVQLSPLPQGVAPAPAAD